MLDFEETYRKSEDDLFAGCDEAGRGCSAGPLFAAAVIFPYGFKSNGINDSKKLTEKQREALYDEIIANALAYKVISISPEEVDRLNPYQASRKAMLLALEALDPKPTFVITDAMPLPGYPIPHVDLVKADAKCLCVAAASILAKVSRDRYMEELDKQYPEYGFAKHKGYCTKEHEEALMKYGPIKGIHRFSYKDVRNLEQLKLF